MTARAESNARVMALDAATVVAEDGTWTYSFPTPLTGSGSYS
jgi:hypothetical protein